MTAGRGLPQDRRVADGGTPAALIVIRASHCTVPMAPTEAVPIGVGTHLAAGDTFADGLSGSALGITNRRDVPTMRGRSPPTN